MARSSGWVISSIHIGRAPSTRRAKSTAMVGVSSPWASIRMSTSSPTTSRMRWMAAAPSRTSRVGCTTLSLTVRGPVLMAV